MVVRTPSLARGAFHLTHPGVPFGVEDPVSYLSLGSRLHGVDAKFQPAGSATKVRLVRGLGVDPLQPQDAPCPSRA
jgi:hypothetical protein